MTIYGDTGREPEVFDAFMAAAQGAGVDPATIRVPSRKPLVEPPPQAVSMATDANDATVNEVKARRRGRREEGRRGAGT